MAASRKTLVGRKAEIREIETALRRSHSGLVVVYGNPGIGKTAVVETVLRSLERDGALVIRLTPAAAGKTSINAVADLICDAMIETADSDLILVAAVRRAQSKANRHPWHFLQLLREIEALVRQAAARRPVAVLLDDAHLVADSFTGLLRMMLLDMRSDGVSVVVAGQQTPDRPGVTYPLAAADQVVALTPLTREQTGTLIGHRVGRPAAPELVAGLCEALGPVDGYPHAILQAVSQLQRQNRILTVDGYACLTDPDTAVQLAPGSIAVGTEWTPAELPVADRIAMNGMLALLTSLTASAETTVDDLLSLGPALGWSVQRLGLVLDLLVECRMVTVDKQDGLHCAGLATDVTSGATWTEQQIARLHARVVVNGFRRLPSDAGAASVMNSEPRLCDHALAAQQELPGGLLDDVLLAVVQSTSTQEWRQTKRAAAALCHRLPLNDQRLPGVLCTAISLMLRDGDIRNVLDLSSQMLPRITANFPATHELLPWLACAWALAALHEQWGGMPAVDRGDAAGAAARAPMAAAISELAARLQGQPSQASDAPAHAGPVPRLSTPLPAEVPSAGPQFSSLVADRSGLPALPVTTVADIKLLTAALGTGAEFKTALGTVQEGRAACGAEPFTAADQLREAAGAGDWASAFETVARDPGPLFEHSPLGAYQRLLREYLSGSWETALVLARQIEATAGGIGSGPLYDHSRSLAAEICRWRGDVARAASWMSGVTDTTDSGPLVSWARCGLRFETGNPADAHRTGWYDYRMLYSHGRLAGLYRLMLRLAWYATQVADDDNVRTTLAAAEELDAAVGARETRMTLLMTRALLRGDEQSGVSAYSLLNPSDDQSLCFSVSVWLARVTGSEHWLAEAWKQCERLSSRRARHILAHAAQTAGRPLPRRRAARPVTGEVELKVVKLVADGATNRQIAASLALSEKSVESYLAKIFRRTGCGTRLELATAWLDGSLTSLGK